MTREELQNATGPMVFSASRSFKTGLKGPLLSFNKT